MPDVEVVSDDTSDDLCTLVIGRSQSCLEHSIKERHTAAQASSARRRMTEKRREMTGILFSTMVRCCWSVEPCVDGLRLLLLVVALMIEECSRPRVEGCCGI